MPEGGTHMEEWKNTMRGAAKREALPMRLLDGVKHMVQNVL